jgi:hypothetical protein
MANFAPTFEAFPESSNYAHLHRHIFYSPPKNDVTYVEAEHSRITNREFHDLPKTYNEESWFHDNTLATALGILARITDCAAHRIALLTPWEAMPFAELAMHNENPEMDVNN